MIVNYLPSEISEFTIVILSVLGLLIGSFLNVVIYRLPKILEADWKQQCREMLEIESDEATAKITLSTPNSSCPHCGHEIKPWENIPVISWVFLRGKCSNCKAGISLRYPIIELVTALLTVSTICLLGTDVYAFATLLLVWALIALTMIDFDTQLLPDNITLPLVWLGLLVNLYTGFIPLQDSVIGAMAGYLSLWSVYWLFKLLTGKEGMGYGDFKLLAALGAWMGWQMLPVIIILSSLVGAILGIAMIVIRGRDRNIPIPFGPYLAAAGWLALVYGHEITQSYLQFARLG